jgi:hypothetical protein
MLRPVLLALATLLAVPAIAQTRVTRLEDTMPPAPPPGGVSVAKDGRIVISSSVCPMLGPAPGVPGADYTPGVDAEGKRVAPADLPSATPPLKLDNIPVEIEANLQQRYGIPANANFQANAIIGFVTVQDGRAYLNGKPIAESDEETMRAACKSAGVR